MFESASESVMRGRSLGIFCFQELMTTAGDRRHIKTNAPMIVAAVVMPMRRPRACRAWTKRATLTREGAGLALTSVSSGISATLPSHCDILILERP